MGFSKVPNWHLRQDFIEVPKWHLKQGFFEVTNCDHLKHLKFSSALPKVFTEQGVANLASVLKSERAIETNVQIMRAFVAMRK